jgi:hypothetical protein
MWISVVVALALLVVGLVLIVRLLKSMGESGIEAAAPGSCRSGRCGVAAQHGPGAGCSSSPPAPTTNRAGSDEAPLGTHAPPGRP